MPDLNWVLSRLDPVQALDIIIVALIIYVAFLAIRGTRAVQLLWGIGLLIFILVSISTFFRLTTLNWLIKNSIPALLVAIPVIFQPELRRILERLGRAGGVVAMPLGLDTGSTAISTIDELVRACARLREHRYGALIILERNTGLQDFIDTGVRLDAALTTEALVTIFFPNTPLHDGAVIVRHNRIYAAGCILPLAEVVDGHPELGTRHRAAVGVTEDTDALAIVISEETSMISLASNGRLTRGYDDVALKNVLLSVFHQPGNNSRSFWRRMSLPGLANGNVHANTANDEAVAESTLIDHR